MSDHDDAIAAVNRAYAAAIEHLYEVLRGSLMNEGAGLPSIRTQVDHGISIAVAARDEMRALIDRHFAEKPKC